MNLNKLESKLDDALSKETTESLTNWLNNKRMENKQHEDAKAYIAQYNNEEELRKEGAVEFAKWLLEQEISYVDNTVYGDVYKYKGVIVGIPELYEIYKQETY